ncbi:conserved hypothetical protein [Alkaliphilus metalliredigens QYMF]|uniref:Glyoxalase-like domain-containing protein n=1 Tax=Alkaliphilus metalliredigens (strain QYMF) TaxID=293826 RepID=A6TUU7_ALKMQ|nr:VOC family protein [Alkaliphilus metalliredigens]ABR49965.1 conserved hypothetical protein [Alkaliphilus metalliredigens QYMF]
MRAGHLIYKVNNLKNAVEEWENKGFVVEYGKPKNPINALIYFSEGPYIELLESTGMPKFVKGVFKIAGKKEFVQRLDEWDLGSEGWLGFCIENDSEDLEYEISILKNYKRKGVYLKNGGRVDVHGRDLRCKVFFPNDLGLPFLMSYFNIDPKPKDFIHPNGISKVSEVVFSTNKESAYILNQLLNDSSVTVEISGEKGVVKEVLFCNSEINRKI